MITFWCAFHVFSMVFQLRIFFCDLRNSFLRVKIITTWCRPLVEMHLPKNCDPYKTMVFPTRITVFSRCRFSNDLCWRLCWRTFTEYSRATKFSEKLMKKWSKKCPKKVTHLRSEIVTILDHFGVSFGSLSGAFGVTFEKK